MMEDFVTYEQAVKLKELGFDWYDQYNQMYYATQNYCEGSSPYSFDTIGTGDLISSPRMKEDENDGWIEDEDYCVLAPTLAQAQKWLRDVKGIIICVGPRFYKNKRPLRGYDYYLFDKDDGYYSHIESETVYDTYEEALSEGINKSLELIQEQSNGNKIN